MTLESLLHMSKFLFFAAALFFYESADFSSFNYSHINTIFSPIKQLIIKCTYFVILSQSII